MLQRRPRDRHQRVDGDGLDAELLQGERHIKAILPRLAHADDTTRADTHPLRLCRLNRADAVGVRMRRADLREIPLRRLDVVVIARHPCLAQAAQLAARDETMRRAEINRQRLPHRPIGVKRLLKLLAREGTARGDDGEAVRPRVLIRLRMSDDLLLREERIRLHPRLVTRRLCTVLAVLPATTAAAVDDRAQIDVVSAELLLQTMSPLLQLLQRSIHEHRAVVLTTDAVARDNLLRQFSNTAFLHKKIPALS